MPLVATTYGKNKLPIRLLFPYRLANYRIYHSVSRSVLAPAHRHTHSLVAMRYAIIGVTSSSVLRNHLAHNWQPCRIEQADNNTNINAILLRQPTVGSVNIENRIFH